MSAVDNITFEPHSDTYLQENQSNQTTTLPLVPNPLVTTQQPLPTTWYHPGKPATQKPPKHQSDSVKHSTTNCLINRTKGRPSNHPDLHGNQPGNCLKPYSNHLVAWFHYLHTTHLLVFGLPLAFQRCGQSLVLVGNNKRWS